MGALAYLNGEFVAPEAARVPIWDRGFLFGDAVYEVSRIYAGRCWLEEEHLNRLMRSLREIRIDSISIDELRARARETIARAGIAEGMVYFHITRGVAQRKHAFPIPLPAPTVLIVALPYDDTETAARRESGVQAIFQPDLRWGRCDIKSTNLLANVLACQAAAEREAIEAILIDESGFVTEATHSSVLWVREGFLEGSPEGYEILPGTTRRWILELARRADIRYREARIAQNELTSADEVILTGTTIEVMPVVRLEGRIIADGKPGAITRTLQAAFRAAVAAWLATPDAVRRSVGGLR